MKLKYFPLKKAVMQIEGSSLLKLIQNEEMVKLDLLVRESIQNSLDAGYHNSKKIRVAFNVYRQELFSLSEYLENFPLKIEYTSHDCSPITLEIRDTGTKGLTGPTSMKGNKKGNLTKLVYSIMKSQETSETGGSWGIGKSVYYRMGIGLVFYYSQIKKGSKFEQRLAVCLVEDAEKKNSLIRRSETGICWWGGENDKAKDQEWPAAETDKTLIDSVIRALGVKPFKDNETGTSVIIPYLKNDLLSGDIAENYGSINNKITEAVIRNYLAFSVQRWYAVRLNNTSYPYGAELESFVNGSKIGDSEIPIMPVYRYLQVLYNLVQKDSDSFEEKDADEFLKSDIKIRSTFSGSTVSGKLVSARLNKHDLHMEEPDNEKSPFFHIFNNPEISAPYPPIIAYTRKPGMIIAWNDDSWIKGLKSSDDENSMILALFVPDSKKQLKDEIKVKTGMDTLEAYLRSCEKADHTKWNDPVSNNIVERIRKNISKNLNEKFFADDKDGEQIRSNLSLSRFLSGNLLPQGFGKDIGGTSGLGRKKDSNDNVIRSRKGKKSSFTIENISYENKKMIISWNLYWGADVNKEHCLELGINAENSVINKQQWEEDKILGEFPFKFDSIYIKNIFHEKNRNNTEKNYLISDIGSSMFDSQYKVEIVLTEETKIFFTVFGDSQIRNHSISGLLNLKYSHKELGMQPVIEHKAE